MSPEHALEIYLDQQESLADQEAYLDKMSKEDEFYSTLLDLQVQANSMTILVRLSLDSLIEHYEQELLDNAGEI